MTKYSDTKTERNLLEAYAGESQARNRYTFFASVAKKEGLELIADAFLRTAANEKEHAELWYKEVCGIGDTQANLALAAQNEREEWSETYRRFAADAEEEGFDELAERFRLVADIEKRHEERFSELKELLETARMFAREEVKIWECRNCGQLVVAAEAPEICPTCEHPRSYYQLYAENY